ncbi:MAG: VWA domain-containing protein [bacterium]|nr:VWA domain-containing protein [bacterium]
MNKFWRDLAVLIFAACALTSNANGQVKRELSLGKGGKMIEVVNRYGKVEVNALKAGDGEAVVKSELTATGKFAIGSEEISVAGSRIEVKPLNGSNRVDVSISVPERSNVKITTTNGEVRVTGNFDEVSVTTETGTIAADIPTDDVRYSLNWRESRPRFLSDFELEKVREASGGRFSIKGKYRSEPPPAAGANKLEPESKATGSPAVADLTDGDDEPKRKDQERKTISLNFTTDRGIILINVPPTDVMSDLRERPLTNAAKAIIRSGDTLLMDAIRRASPRYFGDYTRTLPPYRREPGITVLPTASDLKVSSIKTASVRVTDMQNRAIPGLTAADFETTESGESREVISARPTVAPVNLVLLIDVSGSIENYVTFIRKSARAFITTADPNDRMSIILFNDDVKELTGFSTDRRKLSESLDTFDAGGVTACYDALGFTITDVLRPFRGERTAIVLLSDGDDNRSFLPFDSLMGSIEESGALIYPLYVPTSLIAAAASDPATAVDPLRSRYLSNDLTSKANSEGKRLAEISGGVYYPITQLSQIQTAYDDIVVQLRTSYDVTFRSEISTADGKPSPRLKIRIKRPNTFVQIRSVATRQ